MAKPIELCGVRFASKKEATEVVRAVVGNVIDLNPPGVDLGGLRIGPALAAAGRDLALPDMTVCEFLAAVDEARGKARRLAGYVQWSVDRTYGRPVRQLQVDSGWGHLEPYGYYSPFTPDSPESLAKEAARAAVLADIAKFREDHSEACVQCGARGVPTDVDHFPDAFDLVLAAFVAAKCGGALPRTEEDRLNGGVAFDAATASAWRAWHNEHARLRCLCRPCHRQRTASQAAARAAGRRSR